MTSGIPVADIVQGGIGLVDTALGLINKGKLDREATQLRAQRPQYQISPLTGQDLSLAQSELASNSSAGEKAYNAINNGQFSSSIGATLRAGGTPNDIGSIYANNQDGRLKLAQMQDNLRLARISNLLSTSGRMQDAQQTQWQLNQFAPWEDRMQALQQARLGTSQQINQGINTFATGVANAGQAIQEGNAYSLPSNYSPGMPVYNNPINPINNYKANTFSGANTLTPMNMPTFN